MTRAKGRAHGPRTPMLSEDELRGLGVSERTGPGPSPIPGGERHISNHPTVHQKPEVPVQRPPFHGDMAHGVPPEHHDHHDRQERREAPRTAHKAQSPSTPPIPVPVYLVQSPGEDDRRIRRLVTRTVTVPVSGSEPLRLFGEDQDRVEIMLLCESTNGVKVSESMTELINGNGAKIVGNGTSWTTIKTQGDLWALGTSAGTASTLDIMLITEAKA